MKNYKLLLGSALFSGALLFSATLYFTSAHYIPRNILSDSGSEEKSEDALGASQWLFKIQKDPITGTVDAIGALKARAEALQMDYSRSAAALGLEWQELGPDNVGGRTRAILFDKFNSNKMFAGGVSGGLWVSTNSGSTWSIVPGFDQQPNLAITSITQAANGDIYVGTGEGAFYSTSGNGSQGILGYGIYKSTDGGATFSLLPSTIPVTPNVTSISTNTKFTGVCELAADPVNPNRIYAATLYGLQMTNNGGATWLHPVRFGNGNPNTSGADDVDVASDGTVFANIGNRLYISPNGDSATYTQTSTGLPTTGLIRIEFAVAQSDPNYVYAVAGKSSNKLLEGVYQSIDKGQTFTKIGVGGSTVFEMFKSLGGQADYDMALAVNPGNKYKIFVGGVTLWTWEQKAGTPGVGQWSQAALNQVSSPHPYYVHSDIHDLKFKNASAFYVGCDGGVFRSLDGGKTYQDINNGFNVTQFYSLAYEMDNSQGTGVIAGAQDNGTQYMSGIGGNTSRSAIEVSGGDGFDTEVSFLNPNASFTTVYYGTVRRHSSKGSFGNSFYPSKIVSGNLGNASFVTPIALYETNSATNSVDSIEFNNEPLSQIAGVGDGIKTRFTGYLALPYPSATFAPDSVEFTVGTQVVKDDLSGNLTGDVTGTTNSINYATGYYDFTLASAPVNGDIINASYDVQYNPGAQIEIVRNEYIYPLKYTTPSTINPGDKVKIYDPIQSKFAVGFSGKVWMTKNALDFSKIPEWFNIGTISGDAEELAFSHDGDILYVGTDNGSLYRFANLASIKDSATGDIASPGTVVVKTQIAGFGRFITGISVDPVDKNKVAVSLGGYNQNSNVYFCSTASTCAASTNTSNFSLKQGTGTTKLPSMPVYTVLIEKNDPKRVLVGTELGIYSTADITASNPVWTAEKGTSGLLPNVPVFKLRQQRFNGTVVTNPFVIYAATHGRGVWKSETLKGPVTVGIKESKNSKSTAAESGLKVYPNPMSGEGTILFNLNAATDVVVSIYTIRGELVKTINTGKLNAGEQKVNINTEELSKGTYFVNVDGNNIHAVSKFIILK